MGKTIGRFGYRISAPKKDGIPFEAEVHIVPKYCSPDKSGWPLLSHSLTEPEIDGYIEALKEDLDHVRRLAKRALQRANQRRRELLKERK